MKRRTLRARTGAVIAVAATLVLALVTPAAAAIITTGHVGSGSPAVAQVGDRLYVAWTGTTGTAAAKYLNLGYSLAKGKNIVKLPPDPQYTNPQKSPQGEGPALVADGAGGAGVTMAWTAGDNGNTLTAVRFDGTRFGCFTSFAFLTTDHAPALARDPQGRAWIAWTDRTKHLNVAQLGQSGCTAGGGGLMNLVGRQTLTATSPFGPGLVYDSSGSSELGLLVGWVRDDATRYLSFGTFTGTTTLANVSGPREPVTSLSSPALSSADADLYVVFRGANGHEHLGYSEGCRPSCFTGADTGVVATSGFGVLPYLTEAAYFDAKGNLAFDTFWH